MDQFSRLIEYARANPGTSVVAALAVIGIYLLLNHKNRLTRDAEKRLDELRHERGDQYRKLRPPH